VIRFLRILGFVFLSLLGGLFLLWATGALWFDLPLPETFRKFVAALFFLGVILLWFLARPRLIALIPLALVTAWWFTLQPKSDRDWQSNVAQTAWAEVKGDTVTFNNVRNFEYQPDGHYTPKWETRVVKLSQITGIDLAINYWGSPYMAHPIVSFQFADALPLCFSIETRREVGENYSALGGFYRQYELIYIVSDERDVIRVRTNFNKGEEIYLYRLRMRPEKARERFLEYITALNDLHEHPRWYNAITANCTTSIRNQRAMTARSAWDWRLLVNGFADQMLYEQGVICTGGLPFAELKKQSLINDLAKAADATPDFSNRIRARMLRCLQSR